MSHVLVFWVFWCSPDGQDACSKVKIKRKKLVKVEQKQLTQVNQA